jgi:hypothetical protein
VETFEYDHTLMGSPEGDKKLFVQFYMGFLRNQVKSEEQGRAIFDDVEFIRIHSPGDRTNIVDRPVRPSDKVRFAGQYERFKQGQEIQATGTPLSEWPIVTRGMAEELKYLGFQTVEQVAEANDAACSRHMGLTDLKKKAAAYLEVAKGNTAPIEQLSKRVSEMQSQLESVLEANKVLQQKLAAAEAAESSKKPAATQK